MTVIDRAHKLVLTLVVTTIPAIFLVDFVAEVFQDDITFSSGWQVYAVLVAIAAYQMRHKKWEADWIIVGGGVSTAVMGLMSNAGTKTVMNLSAAMVLVPVVGLVAIAVSRRGPAISGIVLGVASVALATVNSVNEELPFDDVITKSAAEAILFGLGGWLLYQLRRDYERQFANRERFVASISHELRTPLTALSGFSAALADNTIELCSQEAREVVDLLSGQAQEAADIVEDMLVVFRSTSGQVAVDVTTACLATEAETVAAAVEASRLPDSKTIVLDTVPVAVAADPLRLRQIIRNLVTNAIRHGGDSITVRTWAEADGGVVLVADDGPGFDADETEKLFQPYGRSRKTDTKTGSIGLGLTVSRQLARQMGGELSARRAEDLTLFELRLPLAGDS